MSARTPGAILQPQPPPWENEVSFRDCSGAVFISGFHFLDAELSRILAQDSGLETTLAPGIAGGQCVVAHRLSQLSLDQPRRASLGRLPL